MDDATPWQETTGRSLASIGATLPANYSQKPQPNKPPSTPPIVKAIIANLARTWPCGRDTDPDAYADRLRRLAELVSDVPPAALEAAIREHARNGDGFLPQASDLIRIARDAMRSNGSDAQRALANQQRVWDANMKLHSEDNSLRWEAKGFGPWSLYDLRETPNRPDPCEGARP